MDSQRDTPVEVEGAVFEELAPLRSADVIVGHFAERSKMELLQSQKRFELDLVKEKEAHAANLSESQKKTQFERELAKEKHSAELVEAQAKAEFDRMQTKNTNLSLRLQAAFLVLFVALMLVVGLAGTVIWIATGKATEEQIKMLLPFWVGLLGGSGLASALKKKE